MALLAQLQDEVRGAGHQIRMYWPTDVAEAEEIARRVRELKLKSVRYVLALDRFEPTPPAGHRKRASYDVLIAALREVTPKLAEMPAVGPLSD